MAFDHRDGAPAANPYAPLMGRTFVAVGEEGPIGVIDPDRARTLTAWAGELIPGDAEWPGAASVDPVAYVDAVLRKAPTLRPVVLGGIDRVDGAARERHGRAFVDIEGDARVEILREAERSLAPEAFSTVFELVYEAYYRDPRVQEVVRERTGFDVRNTVDGKPMKPFPTERLQSIATRPDHYRSVSA